MILLRPRTRTFRLYPGERNKISRMKYTRTAACRSSIYSPLKQQTLKLYPQLQLNSQSISMLHEKGIPNYCHRTLAWSSDKSAAKVTFTEEQLKGLFKRFDTDGDRRLSKQELDQAFYTLGSSFPAWRTWRALCHADANGDGYISEEEFDSLVKYVVKRGSAIV